MSDTKISSDKRNKGNKGNKSDKADKKRDISSDEEGEGEGEEEEDIKTSKQAAVANKDLLMFLMENLAAIERFNRSKGINEKKKEEESSAAPSSSSSQQFDNKKIISGIRKQNLKALFIDSLSLAQKLSFAVAWAKSSTPEDIISGFIENCKPYWSNIEKREEDFFLTSPNIFAIPEEGKDMIKELWNSNFLTKENKSMIFKYLDNMIEYAKIYEELLDEEEEENRKKEGGKEGRKD